MYMSLLRKEEIELSINRIGLPSRTLVVRVYVIGIDHILKEVKRIEITYRLLH